VPGGHPGRRRVCVSTGESHAIADRLEEALRREFDLVDVTIRVEPD
jgi:divalent metal cation (Fe/Co/Zn/Cd) transporter